MNRALFGGSLLCVIFLLVGTFAFPSNMIMELADTSVLATIFRVLMAAILITVLFTSPPRRAAMRLAMDAMSALLLMSGIAMSLGNNMHLFDVLLFLELGCALGIEALEFNDDELEARTQYYQQQYQAISKTG